MEIGVKKGSSIWQLATEWGNEDVPTNFCSLVFTVARNFTVIALFITCFSTYIGLLLASIAASFSVGRVIFNGPVVALIVCIVAIVLISSVVVIVDKIKYNAVGNPAGVVGNTLNAYRAWKGKYCPKVVVN